MVINGFAHSGGRAQKLAVSHKELHGIAGFRCFDINLGKLNIALLIIGCQTYKGSYKITIICLSVCSSASSAIFLEWLISFF